MVFYLPRTVDHFHHLVFDLTALTHSSIITSLLLYKIGLLQCSKHNHRDPSPAQMSRPRSFSPSLDMVCGEGRSLRPVSAIMARQMLVSAASCPFGLPDGAQRMKAGQREGPQEPQLLQQVLSTLTHGSQDHQTSHLLTCSFSRNSLDQGQWLLAMTSFQPQIL